MHGHAAAVSLGVDEVELVAGAVDKHHPGPGMAGVTGFGLVEGGGDGVLRRVDDRSGQPFRRGLRPWSRGALATAARWRSDDVVRPAWCRDGVEDAGQGGRPQPFGPHHDALAVDLEDQERVGAGGHR